MQNVNLPAVHVRNLVDAFRAGEDVHRATAAEVLGKPAPEVTKDERDRAKFAKLRDHLLRLDDEVTCKTCGKKFEIPSQHSLLFVDQLAGLPNDEELEAEIRAARPLALGDINRVLQAWLTQEYHAALHSETGQSPAKAIEGLRL